MQKTLATVAPVAPAGLIANPGNAQVILSWSGSPGATSYSVKQSLVPGGSYTTIATNVGTLSYLDTGLVNGTTYYYVVSAVNGIGESANSGEASAMPVSGPASWTYTWDANGASGPNPSDGSGSWSAVNQWWNGAANQTWVDNHGVIFGVGTPGGYLVNLGGNTIYASNLTFSTSGYTLTNGALILLGAGTPIVVNAGVSATLKNALTVSVSTITLQVNSAGTLSLAGGGTFGGNLTVAGGGTL